ncbi:MULTISPECIES: LacI family DNA-binding transcriptional regulator [Paenibacillus]|uniref:LacI family DNA-binding transcriptional regulator n=1 Tax=Paenibacillus TaxID=44249 RepID=UPI0003FF4813|nr:MULTISPECIES: LacI family DNA-binding transcriptional regulator [Paenibacillus]KGP77717.1 LacI family transcriptional regulator [Paenibacillus sp. MAEPY2]KGP77971.1 LacI family transcriptional regulator [Paenibacillus sp. MAEPY1]OZQ62836.1 LacI family transcriptional regulator [Paenibacillus taichungensis]SFT00232.1 DNA-binding transcriptional regulator, LacI/PurR family [Paenibacillus sp. 453mf]
MANIQEIARLAGVSTATVSRVINNKKYVNDTTRSKILEIMKQLDYVPNANAISLKKGETHLIGIIAVGFSPIIVNFVRAFTLIAEKNGFNISLFITNGDPEKERIALEMLRRKQLDGLVCLIRSNEWSVIESYVQYGPIVTWQRLDHEKVPSVFMDQYQVYCDGLEYLYRKGYRKILCVYPMSKGLNTKERHRAHTEFLERYHLAESSFPCFEDKMSVHDGEEIAEWWIKQRDRPDAIFCSNDDVAAGLITVLRRSGFSIPGDLGVMGFDNSMLSHLLDITTIHYPIDQQAENAFVILHNQLTQAKNDLHSLSYRIIERAST